MNWKGEKVDERQVRVDLRDLSNGAISGDSVLLQPPGNHTDDNRAGKKYPRGNRTSGKSIAY
jgi:hypothetical protein